MYSCRLFIDTPLACFFTSITPSSRPNAKPLVSEAYVWRAKGRLDKRSVDGQTVGRWSCEWSVRQSVGRTNCRSMNQRSVRQTVGRTNGRSIDKRSVGRTASR